VQNSTDTSDVAAHFLHFTIFGELLGGVLHTQRKLGLQKERLYGAQVFVLPSTSGKNAIGRGAKLRYFRQLAKLLAKLQKESQ